MNKCIQPVICTLYNVSTETLMAHFMEDFRSSFPDSRTSGIHSLTPPYQLRSMGQENACWIWSPGRTAESIHARFNGLQKMYHPVPDKVQQLVLMVKEHLLSVAPQNVAAIPPPTKRIKIRYDRYSCVTLVLKITGKNKGWLLANTTIW